MFIYLKMNIFIPLCGKGERFVKAGYTSPKPFIQVLSKSILEHTLDSILTNIDDTIYIIHNQSSLFDNFEYKNKRLIFIKLTKTTRGASETLYEGIKEGIFQNILSLEDNKRCVCYDCDTFYTIDTLNLYREHVEGNVIFYSINKDKIPLYSYIDVVNNKVSNIVEKEKISDNANSGIYGFSDINLLYKYSKHVIENTNLYMNGECYISCVIKELINNNISISAIEIPSHSVISLGTPLQVENYKNNLHGFLFDLDGTLVLTDDIYIDIWKSILEKYNIVLDETLYVKYIQGNSDLYVMNTLLPNLDISLSDISKMKDTFFINNLSKIKIYTDSKYGIPITKLNPGQHLIKKGVGKNHSKWSPVSSATYRYMPDIKTTSNLTLEDKKKLVKICPMGVFSVDIEDLKYDTKKCTMCNECVYNYKDDVVVDYLKDTVIFTIESTGCLLVGKILNDALDILK